MTEKIQIALRIDPDLLTEIDARVEQVRASGRTQSRNGWFESMARWVIDELPHRADNHDLHWAMQNIPQEGLPRTLSTETRHWHRYLRDPDAKKNTDDWYLRTCACGAVKRDYPGD